MLSSHIPRYLFCSLHKSKSFCSVYISSLFPPKVYELGQALYILVAEGIKGLLGR